MNGQNFKNYYQVLGIHPEAGEEEIKHAYRELARLHHPDSLLNAKNPAGSSADPEFFKSITEAHAVLTNPDKRKEFDYLLAEQKTDSSMHWLKKKPENQEELSSAAKEHFKKKKSAKGAKPQINLNRFEDERIRMVIICFLGVFSGIICALFLYVVLKLLFRF